ncbi:MAG: hypothetical protein BroJett040_08480 [Oligoflexia bacterium]|nr:MAG: hypothetical protein BroJett040_08480 [Oligoflexia bacterium]
MEGLAPTLKFVLGLRLGLERGDSLRAALQRYLQCHSDDFTKKLSQFLSLRDQNRLDSNFFAKISSPYRRAVLQLVDRGLAGDSILQQVKILEIEIHEVCSAELDAFVAQLPFKVLLPLVLFVFPAFMILLLGPLVLSLLASI